MSLLQKNNRTLANILIQVFCVSRWCCSTIVYRGSAAQLSWVRLEFVTMIRIRKKIEMRTRTPVSRGSFAFRFAPFDVVWAFLSPLLALWIRNAPVLSSPEGSLIVAVAIYCAIAFVSSLIAFLVFRTRDGMTHLFSVN